MQEIFITLISSGAISSFATYFFTKKRNELDNTEQAIKIWRDTAERLNLRVEALENEVRALTTELKKHK